MADNKLQAIEAKIDVLIEKINDVNVTLAKNTESLIIHEKRTDIAERKIDVLNGRIDEIKDREHIQFKELTEFVQDKVDTINEKITPIKNHVEILDKTFNIVWKIIIPTIAAVFVALYKTGIIKI